MISTIIENFLYLGSLIDVFTPAYFNEYEITHLINLSLTRIVVDSSIDVLHLPLYDTLNENLTNSFKQTNEFIEKCHEKNKGRCLVVCKHGRSRSVAIVLAYLIEYHGHSLSSAYIFISNVRPKINPNRNYLKQLDQYSSQSEQNRSSSTIYCSINDQREKEKSIIY